MNHKRMIRPALFGIAALAVLGLAGVPVVALLPFLVFLACPLMMVFMMRNMSHGDNGGSCHGSHDHGETATQAGEPAR